MKALLSAKLLHEQKTTACIISRLSLPSESYEVIKSIVRIKFEIQSSRYQAVHRWKKCPGGTGGHLECLLL